MPNLVTIYGGSGFVGRYIARRMAQAGWRVRVAVRRPNEALFVRPYGVVGQVEPVFCNIRDDASVAAAMDGAEAVVNCVGIAQQTGKNTFDAAQHEGAERIARIAAQKGVGKLVHLSAIGADTQSDSLYAQSKGAGEDGVLAHFPNAMILRPSVIFGTEDEFFNRFGKMARMSPVLPLVGADTLFQPVYVDDVANAATKGILGGAQGIYELGGPDVMSFRDLMREMLQVISRKRLIMSLPYWVGNIIGFGMEALRFLSFGLFDAQLTRDQVKLLRRDNVVAEGAKNFADLDIVPTAMEAVLPEYLWPYRPSGQYSEIMASARNLQLD